MHVTLLDSNWEFRPQDRGPGYWQPNVRYLDWLPACVPGAIHLDLARHGIIPDPFHRRFEFGVQWVDSAAWSYRTTFDWAPKSGAPRRVLRFAGLDTVCTVFLNDELLAEHDNMFLPLEVDVTDRLKEGKNEVRIDFASAVKVAMERRDAYFAAEGLDRRIDFFDERAFVRKAGYMFAWDWGPRLVSCGIWQPVELLEFAARITSVNWLQEPLGDGRFRVTPTAEVEGEGKLSFVFNGETKGPGESFEITPELWWPNGFGAQPLYVAEARLSTGLNLTNKLGFRTISLDREGGAFQFVVNGVPIFAAGANWIPNDSFPGRITDQDYKNQLAVCRDLNMNMVRVWGGGLYETEAFYDACDELGLLVWQDFPFACSYYPDDAAMQAIVDKEARYHVGRLRHRACLALWCGNNENLTMWQNKWGTTHPPRYYGRPIYEETLAQVVADLDPAHPYIPSSPIGPEPDANGNGAGDQHYWDVWHGKGDWTFYTDSGARFSSEFGFASACNPGLWRRTLHDLTLGGQEHLSHDKTNKAWETFFGFVQLHYPTPTNLDEWTYRSQLNQRDAMRFGIEHYRRSHDCAGALVWQFNDCWPVQSWALQDYERKLKIAGWEMARLCAPVLLSLHGNEVWVVNSGPRQVSLTVHATAFDTQSGEALPWEPALSVAGTAQKEHRDHGAVTTADPQLAVAFSATLAPGNGLCLGHLDLGAFNPDATAVRLTVEGQPHLTRWSLLGEPKNTAFEPCRITALGNGDYKVEGFVRDLVAWQGDAWLYSKTVHNTAVTAANEVIHFETTSEEPIRFLSLAGEHPTS